MGSCGNCAGSGSSNTPSIIPPEATTPVCGGSTAITCSPMQAPLPSPLPDNIPPTAMIAPRLTSCQNGGEVPPGSQCDETLDDLLLEMQRFLHCTLSAYEISKYPGTCGVLRVKAGQVSIEGMSVLFDECLSCVEARKICAGNEGDVLTTVNGIASWEPPTGGAATVTCADLLPLLERDGCIEAGSDLRYVVGYDNTSDTLQYFPFSSTGVDCTSLKAVLCDSDCFDVSTGTASLVFGKDANGVCGYYQSGGAFDCGAFRGALTGATAGQSTVSSTACLAVNTATPVYLIGQDDDGEPYIYPYTAPTGGGSTDCADWPANVVNCLPLANAGEEPEGLVGWGGGIGRRFPVADPYHAEIRASTASSNGPNKTQVMNPVFGFQDVIGLWGDVGESGNGGSSWFNAGTGRVTIGRAGLYHIDWAVFARVIMNGGANRLGNLYSGMTIVRAANTYNGGTYRNEAAIFRGAQQNFYADGLQWDSALSGSITMAMNQGDQLWMRVALAATSPGITVGSFTLRDDNAAWFTVTQLTDKVIEAFAP